MADIQVADGFSLINRWLLYTSVMLAPAQFISGIGTSCPSSVGFLAYNIYTQVKWLIAVEQRQLHALSLLLPHFNLVFLLSYLGGVSTGTLAVGIPLGLGTAAAIILNTISAWKSWAHCMPMGYGDYQFFFFGWRTLTRQWHTFFTLWQVTDSLLAAGAVLVAIALPISMGLKEGDKKQPWWATYVAILPGTVLALFAEFPLILWTELIVSRNQIDSPTDWVAVWLFVAQAAAMLLSIPFFAVTDLGWKRVRNGCFGTRAKKDSSTTLQHITVSRV